MWMCYNVTYLLCFVLSVEGDVRGLVISPEEDKLYIAHFPDKKIDVTSLNGSGERTLINCTSYAVGLTVDLNMREYFHAMLHICCNTNTNTNTFISGKNPYTIGTYIKTSK